MLAPSFNGVYMFGLAVEMKPCQVEPIEHQQTDYPGLDGIEEMKLGARGAFSTITGIVNAPDAGSLNVALGTLRSSVLWGHCVLTDNFGNSWPFVRMHTFELKSRVYVDAYYGFCQHYECKLFHAVLP